MKKPLGLGGFFPQRLENCCINTARCDMTRVLSARCKIEADWMERIGVAITAAAGVALTTGVIAAFIYFMIALASIVSVRPGFPQSVPPEARLLPQSFQRADLPALCRNRTHALRQIVLGLKDGVYPAAPAIGPAES